jgi:hypothetical protein
MAKHREIWYEKTSSSHIPDVCIMLGDGYLDFSIKALRPDFLKRRLPDEFLAHASVSILDRFRQGNKESVTRYG